MEKTIALLRVQWNVFRSTLGKWNFLLNITDHNQPIKRPEFNEVLYNSELSRNFEVRAQCSFSKPFRLTSVYSIPIKFSDRGGYAPRHCLGGGG